VSLLLHLHAAHHAAAGPAVAAQPRVTYDVFVSAGLHYMQLTTLLPGLALVYLAYNMAKPWAIR
jgi:hypothetical protein